MKAFIDANVIVYAALDGPPSRSCESILSAVAEGQLVGATSVNVLEEVWHLELSGRIPELAGQLDRSLRIFAEILPVTATTLARAKELDLGSRLGANDRLHVATCLENDISAIITADRAFEAISGLARIDPLDKIALGRL